MNDIEDGISIKSFANVPEKIETLTFGSNHSDQDNSSHQEPHELILRCLANMDLYFKKAKFFTPEVNSDDFRLSGEDYSEYGGHRLVD